MKYLIALALVFMVKTGFSQITYAYHLGKPDYQVFTMIADPVNPLKTVFIYSVSGKSPSYYRPVSAVKVLGLDLMGVKADGADKLFFVYLTPDHLTLRVFDDRYQPVIDLPCDSKSLNPTPVNSSAPVITTEQALTLLKLLL